ncbi:hypothetical protein ACHHYP_07923 [Achlya hypogyna]|uniref:N-acetyltransferase domain-containing protein n=1 Tax=Achlya hypogyna TaxID=1202772 RepID=A0A1V9YQ99_ACHHY|nr:hypothetical protein ACHHYP_07923 [Achlya hypogyna]
MVTIAEVATADEFMEQTQLLRLGAIEMSNLITMSTTLAPVTPTKTKWFFLLTADGAAAPTSYAVLSPGGPTLGPHMTRKEAFALGAHLAAAELVSITQVHGYEPSTKAFVEGYQQVHPETTWTSEGEAGLVYRLEALLSPANVTGSLRVANLKDTEKLVDWMIAFKFDCYGAQLPREAATASVTSSIAHRRMHFWVVDDEPVGFGSYAPPMTTATTTVYMLGPIYIAPEARRKGYAKGLTAALTNEVTRTCPTASTAIMLISGADNKASNQTYRSLGFTPLGILKGYSLKAP